MLSIEKMIEKYKDLVIKESFKDVDPKTVTNEMIQSKLEKGWMYCPSKNKVACFSCGSFLKIKLEEMNGNTTCLVCDRSFV